MWPVTFETFHQSGEETRLDQEEDNDKDNDKDNDNDEDIYKFREHLQRAIPETLRQYKYKDEFLRYF